MPGEKEMSWQDCLVDRRWLARHIQRVREDLLRQVEEKRARLDPARREGKDAEVNALKREINYLRSREEMIGRRGLVPARHVTLWGLQRLLAQGQPPELGCQIFYGGGRKGPDAASLLELVFAGTCLDICALWKEQGRSQKTVANKVSILQHGPYQYVEKGKQEICETALSALEERYRAGRLPTLEAVAGNLRAARRRDGCVWTRRQRTGSGRSFPMFRNSSGGSRSAPTCRERSWRCGSWRRSSSWPCCGSSAGERVPRSSNGSGAKAPP